MERQGSNAYSKTIPTNKYKTYRRDQATIEMEHVKTIDIHKAEEPLTISDSTRRYTGVLSWLKLWIARTIATDPWGDSCIGGSRRVPSVHPVPG